MNSASDNLQTKLVKRLQAEPAKAGMLVLLVVVMGVLWVRAMGGGASPAKAMAKLMGGPASENAPVATDTRGGRSLKQLAEWVKTPAAPTRRNLFAMNLDYFPADGSRAPEKSASGANFWEQVEKSLATKADQDKARRILVENLRLRAARLDLQTTVMSSGAPKALINGGLVVEGDVVDGFRVVKIEARRIVVEREGIRFEVLFNFKK